MGTGRASSFVIDGIYQTRQLRHLISTTLVVKLPTVSREKTDTFLEHRIVAAINLR